MIIPLMIMNIVASVVYVITTRGPIGLFLTGLNNGDSWGLKGILFGLGLGA